MCSKIADLHEQTRLWRQRRNMLRAKSDAQKEEIDKAQKEIDKVRAIYDQLKLTGKETKRQVSDAQIKKTTRHCKSFLDHTLKHYKNEKDTPCLSSSDIPQAFNSRAFLTVDAKIHRTRRACFWIWRMARLMRRFAAVS